MNEELFDAVVGGNARAAERLAEESLIAGVDPARVICESVLPALDEVGRRYECNEYFIPELLIATRAANCALNVLKREFGADQPVKGCVVAGTVAGELHDTGIKIICLLLEWSGFTAVYLDCDVPAERFVEAVRQNKAQILMLSASNLPQLPCLKDVIEELKKASLRDKVKVMVGGPSVTQKYADEIGADAYAKNAVEAVSLARNLL